MKELLLLIRNKDVSVIDSTLENTNRRIELVHQRIDRTDEKINELRERIRKTEMWLRVLVLSLQQQQQL